MLNLRELMTKIVQLSFAVSLFFAASCAAGDERAVGELASEINSFTKAATQTKQNIDYLPFIMSVWDGEQLSKLGVRTLKDALMLFPGVDVSVDNVRNSSPIFRGSNPFAYGQSRLLIDGVVVNDRTFDGYSIYLDMPIDMIKRIEVVRGPGSFAEGANGYAGTISVVTYAEKGSKDDSRAYITGGSYGSYGGGAVLNKKLGEWQLHVDAYHYKDDAKTATSGKDGFAYSPVNSALSSSGDAQTWLDTSALGISVANEEFSLSGRFTAYKLGSAFGNFYVLPNDEGRQEMPSWYIEGKYKKELTEDAYVEAKAGYMEDGWESYARTYPAGTRIGAMSFVDGYWADLALKNRIAYGGLSVKYDGFDNHSIKVGTYQSFEKNIDVRSITTNRLTGSGWVDYSATAPFFDGDAARRKTVKLYASDFWNISDKWALSCELGSDKGSDFDRQNDYRVAAVWQASDVDILKFMTSTAYRAPAWQELYGMNNPARVGNRSLKPERVRAYEAQYIKKLDIDDSFGVNLFYLQNKNQINKINPQNEYRNVCDLTIYGSEVEYKKKFGSGHIYAGYSYISGKSADSNTLPTAASHLIKTAALKELGGGFSLGGALIYVGEKKRTIGDNRDNTHAYMSTDVALNYDAKRWGAQLAVRNASDSAISYPSERNTYSGDYPTSKQFFFVKLFGRF